MKKYYLHHKDEQLGPFSIEELKEKQIRGNTPIWYEGLSDWTTAEKVEDLKVLFKTPPPFESKQPPSPIQKLPTEKPAEKESKPKKKRRIGLVITVLIICLLIAGALVIISNNPDAIPGVKFEINTPKPIVLGERYDNKYSTLFKEKGSVYATIQNQGGDGNVLVTFRIDQGSNSYDRSKSIYLSAGESKDVEETFEQVTRLGGQVIYSVEARAE